MRQVAAPVGGNARIEDVMVAALDHIDRVDLHIAQMRDRRLYRLWSRPERLGYIKPLRGHPDGAGAVRSDGDRTFGHEVILCKVHREHCKNEAACQTYPRA